ncbi:hypothetical protein CTI12_AA579890 [Artemisia annua]|uniref:Hybrid signal transduction histidine kinase M n=1 Tax=Artemisia annua TaxID=35608 RepID=A0A2U1KP87_ARTAN|nr:hypothetical protein CTI12_AA579890 [Artemisia annua]
MVNTTPPPVTTSRYEKLNNLGPIKNLIPVKLDEEKLNFSYWSELFLNILEGLKVLDFVQPPPVAESSSDPPPPDDDWLATEKMIKSWIYLTISEPLFERVVKAKPRTSKDTWDVLEKIFHDNKRSKTVELMGELRDLDMGDLTVDSYFRKIDSIVTRLGNLGSNISEEDIVTYAINGLSDKYDPVAHVILNRDPFPDLETVRSMVTMAETYRE